MKMVVDFTLTQTFQIERRSVSSLKVLWRKGVESFLEQVYGKLQATPERFFLRVIFPINLFSQERRNKDGGI